METMSIFSKVCPFYPGDLLLGPQELRFFCCLELIGVGVGVGLVR